MPATRVGLRDGIRRRRSSLAIGSLPYIKPGKYNASTESSQNVTFAPNVTPITYNEQDELLDEGLLSVSPDALFPPSQSPSPETKRRPTGGKRRSLSHIPRPPNAFMLFRADFVRQKHVPGSIETSHISLSKIIGNVWRALPLPERENWAQLAKKAKAEHKLMYPNYKFRPVHNKEKKKAKDAKKKPTPAPVSEDDELRADVVAQMMLEGKKGEDLVAAVRAWELREKSADAMASPDFSLGADQLYASSSNVPLYNPVPLYAGYRRSSSVPLPAYNQIAIPSVPFLMNSFPGGSRVPSPVNNISGISRGFLGQRRASSVQPVPSQSWGFSNAIWDQPQQLYSLHRDPTPLPEADTSLFQTEYMTQGSNVLSGQASRKDFSNFAHTNSLSLNVSPLEGIPPLSTDFSHPVDPYSATTAGDFYSATTYSSAPSPVSAYPESYSQHSHMGEAAPWPQSGTNSTFSGSPALTEHSLGEAGVIAPRPLHPSQHVQVEEWSHMTAPDAAQVALDAHAGPSFEEMVSSMEAEQNQVHAPEMGLQMAHGDYDMFATDGGYGGEAAMHTVAAGDAYPGFEALRMDMAAF